MNQFEDKFGTKSISYAKIADIFVIRNSPQKISSEFAKNAHKNILFENLPQIPKDSILRLSKKLSEQVSLREALQCIDLELEFSIEKCLQVGSHDPMDVFYINSLVFAYYCIAWAKQDVDILRINDFHFIISSFTQQIGGPFQDVLNDLFIGISLFAMDNERFKFTPVEYSLILEHLHNNRTFTKENFPFLINLLSKGLQTKDVQIYKTSLNLLNALLAQKRAIIDQENAHIFISLLSQYLTDLDPLALSVLCYTSEISTKEEIKDAFVMIPSNILTKITLREPKINTQTVQTQMDMEENQFSEDSEFIYSLPKVEDVQSETTFIDFVPQDVQEAVNAIVLLFERINNLHAQSFITTLVSLIIPTKIMPHKLDFLIAISPLIKAASKLVSIDSLEAFFFDEVSFNPYVNIFCGKLPENLNFVRNTIINTVQFAPTLLCKVITNYENHPFLYAEIITRLLYFQSLNASDEQPPNISGETLIKSLLDVSLKIAKTETNHSKQMLLARSVIFTYLFDMFSQPSTALQCFTSDTFMSNFSVLMQEPSMSSTVLNSLTKAMGGLSFLPGPVCGVFSALLANCCAKNEDQFYYSLGTQLSKIIVQSLLINHCIISSISSFVSPLLSFLAIKPDSENLEILLQLLSVMCQAYESIQLTDSQFNTVLDIIQTVDGDEPSEQTQSLLLNLMNNSASSSQSKMAIIKMPTAVPYIFFSFYKSKKFDEILEYFTKLCKYSDQNIYVFHEGQLSFLLLQSLKGNFEYRGRKIEIHFSETTIKDKILPLVSLMCETKSSPIIDNLYLSLILPDKEGNFSPFAVDVLKEMNSILYHIDTRPKPVFPINKPRPILFYHKLNQDALNNTFLLTFWMKIDYAAIQSENTNFIIMSVIDEYGGTKLVLCLQGCNLVLYYESNSIRSSAPIIRQISTNNWARYTIGIGVTPNKITVYPYFNNDKIDETEYRRFTFKGKLHFCFCYTEQQLNISRDRPPYVQLGPFVAIPNGELSSICDAKIETLAKQQNVLFSYLTFTEKVDDDYFETACTNLASTLPKHLKCTDFYNVFELLDKSPPNYAEYLITLILYANNIKNTEQSYHITNIQQNYPLKETNELLAKLTKIPFNENEDIYGSFEYQKDVNISDLSGLLYMIPRNAAKVLNYQTFNSCSSLLSNINNQNLQTELIENILFNVWFWCSSDEVSLQKITNYWLNTAANLSTSKLFQNFLFQTYALLFNSKQKYTKIENSLQKILEELSLVKSKLSDEDIQSLIELIVVINDPSKSEIYLNILYNYLLETRRHLSGKEGLQLFNIIKLCNMNQFKKLFDFYMQCCEVKHAQVLTFNSALTFFENSKEKQTDETFYNVELHCLDYLINHSTEQFKPFPVDRLINKNISLWFFWPLVVGLWNEEASDICIDFIVQNITHNPNLISIALSKIFFVIDYLESLSLFNAEKFRYKFFLKLCTYVQAINEEVPENRGNDTADQSHQEEETIFSEETEDSVIKFSLILGSKHEQRTLTEIVKHKFAVNIVTFGLQEFFYRLTDTSYDNNLLELMQKQESDLIEDKELLEEIINENNKNGALLKSPSEGPFDLAEFTKRIQTIDVSKYYYKIKATEMTDDFLEICKQIEIVSKYNTSPSQRWKEAAQFFIQFAGDKMQNLVIKVQNKRNSDTLYNITSGSMRLRLGSLHKIITRVQRIFKKPHMERIKPAEEVLSNVQKKVNKQKSIYHMINEYSFIKSKSSKIPEQSYFKFYRFIPIALDIKSQEIQGQQIFNPIQHYKELFTAGDSSFVENSAQFSTICNVFVANEKVKCSLEFWLTKLVIKQIGNQPFIIEYKSIRYVIASIKPKFVIYTTSLDSLVLEIESTEEFEKTIQEFQKQNLNILINPHLYAKQITEDFIKNHKSHYEYFSNLNILFGKNFDDYNNYFMMPALLRKSDGGRTTISFGFKPPPNKYLSQDSQNDSPKPERAELIKKLLTTKEVDSDALIQENFDNYNCITPEFYSSFGFFSSSNEQTESKDDSSESESKRVVTVAPSIQNPLLYPYIYRSWLENKGLTDSVVTLAEQIFEFNSNKESILRIDQPKEFRTETAESKTTIITDSSKIIFCDNAKFIFTFSQGTLLCYLVDFANGTISEVARASNYQSISKYIYTTAKSNLILSNAMNGEIKCVSKQLTENFNASVPYIITKMETMFPYIVFCTKEGLLLISSFNDFPYKYRVLYTPINEIEYICCNEEIDVVVCAEKGGLVTITDTTSSNQIAQFHIEEEILAMTVTKSFSFIVISTKTQVLVYSIQGLLIQKAPAIPRVSRLISFRTESGVDYVYAIGGQLLYLFEAIYPANVKTIYNFNSTPLNAEYSESQKTLVVALQNRKILFIPFITN